jgi:hypothetical protein
MPHGPGNLALPGPFQPQMPFAQDDHHTGCDDEVLMDW